MSSPNMADSLLTVTRALPNGAATVTSTAIDLEVVSSSDNFLAQTEVLLQAPALTTSQLVDTYTMTYELWSSPNADLSSAVKIDPLFIVQTGAGGVGAAAASNRFRPTTNTQRYLFFKVTGNHSGDATGATATMKLVF